MKAQTPSSKTGNSDKPTDTGGNNKPKTDIPLSEKEEVKKTETRTRKALKDYL